MEAGIKLQPDCMLIVFMLHLLDIDSFGKIVRGIGWTNPALTQEGGKREQNASRFWELFESAQRRCTSKKSKQEIETGLTTAEGTNMLVAFASSRS
jgi:hypothetical protein